MILPDVNVLIYALRKDAIDHELARDWLTETVSSGIRYGISPLALGAVVRIVTNARVFKEPSSLDEAFAFSDFLLEQPNCERVEPGEQHWSVFKRLCEVSRTTGPRVSDVWYAALAIERGCEWITFDRDYGRFPGLKWRLPSMGP